MFSSSNASVDVIKFRNTKAGFGFGLTNEEYEMN